MSSPYIQLPSAVAATVRLAVLITAASRAHTQTDIHVLRAERPKLLR